MDEDFAMEGRICLKTGMGGGWVVGSWPNNHGYVPGIELQSLDLVPATPGVVCAGSDLTLGLVQRGRK